MQNTEQMEKVTQGLMQACSEAQNITRDSMNAALQAATHMTKGCDEMCQSVTSMVQSSLAQSMTASKAMLSAKSMRDLVEMQSSLMKNGFDFMMKELSRMTEISTRTTQQAMAPVAEHMNATISKISQKQARLSALPGAFFMASLIKPRRHAGVFYCVI